MDKWEEMREGIRKFEQSPVISEDLLKAMDHISLIDYWKRRAEEERELLTSLRRHLDERERDWHAEHMQAEAMERSFEDRRRIWEKEREALEEKLKAREKEIELLRERADWEVKFQEAVKKLSKGGAAAATNGDGPEDIYVAHELRRIAKELLSLRDTLDDVHVAAGWIEKEKGRFMDLLQSSSERAPAQEMSTMRDALEKIAKQMASFQEGVYKKLEDGLSVRPEPKAAQPALREDAIIIAGDVPGAGQADTVAVKKWMERLQDFHWSQEDSARGFCHKARNLLGIISGTAQIGLTDELLAPDMKENLTTIDQNATLLLQSIEEFLAITKYPQMNYEEVDVNQLIQQVAAGNEFKLELGSGLQAVRVDRNLLKEALTCVLVNAKESGATEGSPIVISTGRDEAEKSLVISIKDSGKGIGENHFKKVFQPYFTTKKEQRGLGLSKARHYVSLHGGKIGVESVKGSGTTVRIWLPL